MGPDSWQVWYLLYLIDGLWFAVAGAAYISDKMFLKWLTLTFYHTFVINLSLRFVLWRDERIFGTFADGFPLFEVQTIGTLVVFMLLTSKHPIFEDAYAYIVVLIVPPIAVAILLLSGMLTLGNALVSLAIGGLFGYIYSWVYRNMIPHITRDYITDKESPSLE